MKTLLLILSVFVAAGFNSCQKENLGTSKDITGKWTWVKSVGGIAGMTLTPQSTGNHFRDEYAGTNYKRFKNDTLITQSSFSITRDYPYTDTEKVDVLNIGDTKTAFVIRNDTLYLSQLFISDGFSSVYVRVK